ncbi:MAG: hypothetical protein JRF55_02210 [Deltaproteobacteria bacterium]|nr:hypothetical protein [Deltaproteobacteria bacterium]
MLARIALLFQRVRRLLLAVRGRHLIVANHVPNPGNGFLFDPVVLLRDELRVVGRLHVGVGAVLLHGLRRLNRRLLRVIGPLRLLLRQCLLLHGLCLPLALRPLLLPWLLPGPLGLAVVRELEINLDRIEVPRLLCLVGLRPKTVGQPAEHLVDGKMHR